MPLGAVSLVPGVNVELTPTALQTGYSTASLIRFRDGMAEKRGGWEQYFGFPVGSTVRALHAWEDLGGDQHLAIGALARLAVLTDGTALTITPQTTTTNPAIDFSTTSGDATVEIVDAGITPNTLNTVSIETQVSVGGLILFGVYQIATVTGADSYTIEANGLATATETNAGAVPEYDTTSASSTVTVTLPDHGYSVGDTYYALVSTTGGGVTVLGQYLIQSVGSVDEFSIFVDSPATSTATFSENSGAARMLYYITVGPQVAASGYGLGGYGLGGYGLGVAPPTGTGTPITATDWTLGNFGEILIANPDGGAIYSWRPDTGYQTASIISQAPNVNTGIFIAMPQRQIVAYGSCAIDGVQDQLLIRYCQPSDFTIWTASSTNQAGSFRISNGSKIVGAIQAPQQGLIFTDIGLHAMQYIGPPLVYGFNELMTGCGLVGKHAVGILGGVVYWMSRRQFFVKGGGGPQPLPCTVWDDVFQDIDEDNLDLVCCAVNSEFNEVEWFFPSAEGGGVIDKSVKYNPVERAWDINPLARTAWIDQSVLGSPIGAGTDQIIYQHEMGYNDAGQPIIAYFETGWFVLGDAEEFVFVDQFQPDMKWGTYPGSGDASIQLTISTVEWPNGFVTNYGPFTMNEATEYLSTRCRGRMAKLRFQSSDLDSFWRLGRIRYRFARDGRR